MEHPQFLWAACPVSHPCHNKEFFFYVQYKSTLFQSEDISPCPITHALARWLHSSCRLLLCTGKMMEKISDSKYQTVSYFSAGLNSGKSHKTKLILYVLTWNNKKPSNAPAEWNPMHWAGCTRNQVQRPFAGCSHTHCTWCFTIFSPCWGDSGLAAYRAVPFLHKQQRLFIRNVSH